MKLFKEKERKAFIESTDANIHFAIFGLSIICMLLIGMQFIPERDYIFGPICLLLAALISIPLYLVKKRVKSIQPYLSSYEIHRAAQEIEESELAEKEKISMYFEYCKRNVWIEEKIPFYKWVLWKQLLVYSLAILAIGTATYGGLTILGYFPIPENGWYAKRLQASNKSIFIERIIWGSVLTLMGLFALYMITIFVLMRQKTTRIVAKDEDEWESKITI